MVEKQIPLVCPTHGERLLCLIVTYDIKSGIPKLLIEEIIKALYEIGYTDIKASIYSKREDKAILFLYLTLVKPNIEPEDVIRELKRRVKGINVTYILPQTPLALIDTIGYPLKSGDIRIFAFDEKAINSAFTEMYKRMGVTALVILFYIGLYIGKSIVKSYYNVLFGGGMEDVETVFTIFLYLLQAMGWGKMEVLEFSDRRIVVRARDVIGLLARTSGETQILGSLDPLTRGLIAGILNEITGRNWRGREVSFSIRNGETEVVFEYTLA